MKIEELIEKYFNGETTLEEENFLKHYFSTGDYEKKFEIYRSYFLFLQSEKAIVSNDSVPSQILQKPLKRNRNFFKLEYKWYALAASLLIILVTVYYYFSERKQDTTIVITNENFYENEEVGTELTKEAFNKIAKYMGYAQASIDEIKTLNETIELLQKYKLINNQLHHKEI